MDLIKPSAAHRFETEGVIGCLDRLRDFAICGWVASKVDRRDKFKITAAGPSGYVRVESGLPRPDVFRETALSLDCGYEINFGALISDDLLFGVGAAEDVDFTIVVEGSDGATITHLHLVYARAEIIKSRFRLEVTRNQYPILEGIWRDFGNGSDDLTQISLENGRGGRLEAGRTPGESPVKVVAFKFNGTLAFVAQNAPFRLVVGLRNIVVHEETVQLSPFAFHVDNAERICSGWAVTVADVRSRPLVVLTAQDGRSREMRACLYRRDTRRHVAQFDGFCGFRIPTDNMPYPLTMTIRNREASMSLVVQAKN